MADDKFTHEEWERRREQRRQDIGEVVEDKLKNGAGDILAQKVSDKVNRKFERFGLKEEHAEEIVEDFRWVHKRRTREEKVMDRILSVIGGAAAMAILGAIGLALKAFVDGG